MDENMALFLVSFVVVGIPVIGLTARFALKPVVEAIIRVREAFVESPGGGPGRAEIERLEAEIHALRSEVRRLAETAEFDRKLLGDMDDA